jgi:hypothetical protein
MILLDEITVALAVPDWFEAWLREHDPAETVGTSQSECDCPLANFVHDRLALRDFNVVEETWDAWRPEEPYVWRAGFLTPSSTAYVLACGPLPAWAKAFVARVDAVETDHDDTMIAVSAAAALDVLTEVLA